MSKGTARLPRGASVVCLDAMILIGYASADLLETLSSFFAAADVHVCTSAWVIDSEIGKHLDTHRANQKIVDADWLHRAAVVDEDILYVQNLLAAWGSAAGKDRGEAEILALCSRHGWIGVSDDHNAHGGAALAKRQGRPFEPSLVRGVSLLAAAAAENLIGVDQAWAVHRAVEARYDDPPIMPITPAFEQAFADAVTALRATRNSQGSPPWPRLLTCGADRIVKAAVRHRNKQLGTV